MDDYVARISKEGHDVKTATGDDLILDADFTMIKVFTDGNGMYQYSDGLIEITHNLGYIPQFLVYYTEFEGAMMLATGYFPEFEFSGCFAWADETNIYFAVGSTIDIRVYYYIFYDQT